MYGAYSAVCCQSKDTKNSYFVPLLISIKTREAYTDKKAKVNIDEIVKPLLKIALILIVLMDRDTEEEDTGESSQSGVTLVSEASVEGSAKPRATTKRLKRTGWPYVSSESLRLAPDQCCNEIVSRIIVIPSKDPFHLTDIVREVTLYMEDEVVFASHPYIGTFESKELGGRRRKSQNNASSVLCSGSKTSTCEQLDALWSNRCTELKEEEDSPMELDT